MSTHDKIMTSIPEKPKKNDPCNGCGVCCIASTCAVGREAFGEFHQVCPALRFEGDRFRCGLMDCPEEYLGDAELEAATGFDSPEWAAAYFRVKVGADKGCDCEDLPMAELFGED